MENKRLELYVWWKCNQKCTYCNEFHTMEQVWNKIVTKFDILKNLLKYKKEWYNHVTYLWWEPFIQPVFLDALKLWKKLNYKVLVTTNATTLHIESQAAKYLPYIDELILSAEAIDKELQQKISRTTSYVRWDSVFENINKYWNWTFFKINIVITKDNLYELFNMVKFLISKWVKNISITYPDIISDYYTKEHILDKIAPRYIECIPEIVKIYEYSKDLNIRIKFVDFPFCTFPEEYRDELIKLTDDYDYQTRLKIWSQWEEINRNNLENIDDMPRDRYWFSKCDWCIYKWKCWGACWHYEWIYALDEINPIN